MAHDGRHPPFPFPIPDPPRIQHSTPFPPPPLPSPEQTLHVLERRVAGVPVPLFFAIGAVVGIVLAMTVVSLVRRSTPKRATQAKVVSVVSAPSVEHAHALFVWTPATAQERAADASIEIDAEPAPLAASSPAARSIAPSSPATRAALAVNRARATPPRAVAPEKRTGALPSDLLSAGLL